MSERSTTTSAVDPVGRSSAAGGGGRIAAAFLLPGVAVAGILAVALVSYDGDCGGLVPGCGNLLNAGSIPILIERTPGGSSQDRLATMTVLPGDRELLLGATNAVRVDPGQCLTVYGGPFWNAVTQVEQAPGAAAGRWVPIDDWGARVQLDAGSCRERD